MRLLSIFRHVPDDLPPVDSPPVVTPQDVEEQERWARRIAELQERFNREVGYLDLNLELLPYRRHEVKK